MTLATSPSTQGTLIVTAEALDANGKSLGTDQATLTMIDNAPVVVAGALDVRSFPYTDGLGNNRVEVAALVTFAPVAGANTYVLDGTGSDDPAYYGTHIVISQADPVNYGSVAGGDFVANAFGLAGGNGPADGGPASVAYYRNRFGGFKFTVTAYFNF